MTDELERCSGCGEYAGSHISDKITTLQAENARLRAIELDRTRLWRVKAKLQSQLAEARAEALEEVLVIVAKAETEASRKLQKATSATSMRNFAATKAAAISIGQAIRALKDQSHAKMP
jgi:hypothetical protein